MKKNICTALVFSLGIIVSSCTKDADVEAVSEKLPSIAITSVGLQQVPTFANTNTIQILFGATTTNVEPGTFDMAWYDGNTRVDSLHFASWMSEKPTVAPAVSYTSVPSSYPNTSVYQGSLLVKLNNLTGGGKKYTLKLYARSKDGKLAAKTMSSFITVQ